MLLITVGFVGGRNYDRRNLGRTAASLQKIPSALDIGGESRSWVAIGDANDSLGCYMEDNFDFVLAEHTLKQGAVGDIAAHGVDLLNATVVHRFALWNPIAYQANDIRAGFKKLRDEP